MKARKRAEIIDVIQLRMHSARSYRKCKDFVGELWIDHNYLPNGLPGIKTWTGFKEISNGDYIIKDISGELYLCKPDEFEQVYEIVED
jgi:hypothetical protein